MNPDLVTGQLGPCQLRATNHVTILIASGVTTNNLSTTINIITLVSWVFVGLELGI